MALTKPKEAPAKGKLEVHGFQIEVETEIQWRGLLRREGLIVVDVFASWAGPCISMINILKRLKVEVNEDRLWMATACSDNIDDLLMFKDQSEPTWLFMGGGKPVRIFRGCNVPKLLAIIKQELAHELSCIAGKARRNLVSIDDEGSRRKKAEAEAARLQQMIKEEITTAESLNEMRRESSVRLMGAMEIYTVLAVQHFIIEAGDVNEIRDFLAGDFKIEQEIYVNLNDDGVRNLFRIPYEILDPNEPEMQEASLQQEEMEDNDRDGDMGNDDDDGENPKVVVKSKKKRTIPVELPEGIIGETLLMILECVDLRKMIDSGKKPAKSSLLQTADDYIQLVVGPTSYQEACEHAPYSLHAVYGKGLYAPGVWCPRNYDDKRYAMINYFPRFVTEVLMPKAPTEPKYMLAVYPLEMAQEVMEQIEVATNAKDILAQGNVKIPPALADEMLDAWKVEGEEVLSRKKALTSGQVFAMSVDKRNSALKLAIKGLKPLHTSFDNAYGKVETAKIFNNLNINIENLPNPDEVVQKFLARSGPRLKPIGVEEPPPKTEEYEGDDEEETTAPNTAPAAVPGAVQSMEEPPKTQPQESTEEKPQPAATDDEGKPMMEEEDMMKTGDEGEDNVVTDTEEEEYDEEDEDE